MTRETYLKGKRAEYELMRKLMRAGYAVMRAPASGAKARRFFYPDIFAVRFDGNRYKVLVFEVKLRKTKEYIFLTGPKVWLLKDFARRAGGEAYVAVKVADEKRWYIFPIDMLEEQQWEKGVRYIITKDMYIKAKSLSEVIS